jgi:hypothetical protein
MRHAAAFQRLAAIIRGNSKGNLLLKATLNAVPFYAAHGWRGHYTEAFRRHGHDIYVAHMELA